MKSVANVEGLEEKADVLEEALSKLNEIVDDYPFSDLAVKLISGQNTGAISLEVVGKAIERVRKEAERAAGEGLLIVWVIPSDGVETGMLLIKLTITDLLL